VGLKIVLDLGDQVRKDGTAHEYNKDLSFRAKPKGAVCSKKGKGESAKSALGRIRRQNNDLQKEIKQEGNGDRDGAGRCRSLSPLLELFLE
jgi:hypothetical protein